MSLQFVEVTSLVRICHSR